MVRSVFPLWSRKKIPKNNALTSVVVHQIGHKHRLGDVRIFLYLRAGPRPPKRKRKETTKLAKLPGRREMPRNCTEQTARAEAAQVLDTKNLLNRSKIEKKWVANSIWSRRRQTNKRVERILQKWPKKRLQNVRHIRNNDNGDLNIRDPQISKTSWSTLPQPISQLNKIFSSQDPTKIQHSELNHTANIDVSITHGTTFPLHFKISKQRLHFEKILLQTETFQTWSCGPYIERFVYIHHLQRVPLRI